MRSVLVDGRALYDASSYRGIGSFLRALLGELARDVRLSVSALVVRGAPLPEGLRPRYVWRFMPNRFATHEHELLLPGEISRARPDVFLSPALDPPRACSAPWIQTVHDVIPLIFPDPRFSDQRVRWETKLGPRLRKASAVVADSAHTASDAIRLLSLDPERVHVAHLGVDPLFKLPDERTMASPPFLLYVGEYDPRKGYREAFEVIARLADSGYPHELKVVGRIAPWVEGQVRMDLDASRRPDRVKLLGYIPTDALLQLYWSATALVVTSRYEGFGLPALEAMACGTPVIAFSNSAITEVVDDAGVLCPDGDVGAFVDAASEILENQRRWTELSAAGVRRARTFTWKQCAQRYSDVLQLVSTDG